ncbi:hypothetical protein L5515_000342 [Caenorhabditis briggsae]|uniref:Uncharacterized protein n=1 Tax=Caenorhabditis briggsae TaxID=6238 RepID=A0AAE9E230_CAEBR|nr:hypothetical protein L5515_000342 [Caenorhabditis briggsae]
MEPGGQVAGRWREEMKDRGHAVIGRKWIVGKATGTIWSLCQSEKWLVELDKDTGDTGTTWSLCQGEKWIGARYAH